jgi:uncharacterized protein YfkK (UPF0435 family)
MASDVSTSVSPYVFTDPFAQSALDGARKNAYGGFPGIGMSEERQAIWVTEELKALFMVRNPMGQTLLYCLLRFTLSNYMRKLILYNATVEQLATKNTNCGSTALMGFVYGEYTNPRMDSDKIKQIIEKANEYKSGVLDVLQIPNNLGETTTYFYNFVIKRQEKQP